MDGDDVAIHLACSVKIVVDGTLTIKTTDGTSVVAGKDLMLVGLDTVHLNPDAASAAGKIADRETMLALKVKDERRRAIEEGRRSFRPCMSAKRLADLDY